MPRLAGEGHTSRANSGGILSLLFWRGLVSLLQNSPPAPALAAALPPPAGPLRFLGRFLARLKPKLKSVAPFFFFGLVVFCLAMRLPPWRVGNRAHFFACFGPLPRISAAMTLPWRCSWRAWAVVVELP